jgi:hypothetical protein
MEERKVKRPSILGPVLLIGAGVVLLLNTLGILDWSVWWQILRLWPVLLIAAGLDLLIGRRSIWGALLVALLVVGVVAGALWLSGTELGTSGLTTEQIRQPLGDATMAEVTLEPAIGVLQLEALPESANLVEGEVRLVKGEIVKYMYIPPQAGKVVYTAGIDGMNWGTFPGFWDDRRLWDLGLSPSPALQLKIELGAGRALLDLTGLNLSVLEADMGLGQTVITLPAEGRFQVKIDGAIGETTLVVPEGMAVRLRADTGLAVRDLPEGYGEQDGVYLSPGYETAENRADLEVNQAIGLLRIRD